MWAESNYFSSDYQLTYECKDYCIDKRDTCAEQCDGDIACQYDCDYQEAICPRVSVGEIRKVFSVKFHKSWFQAAFF